MEELPQRSRLYRVEYLAPPGLRKILLGITEDADVRYADGVLIVLRHGSVVCAYSNVFCFEPLGDQKPQEGQIIPLWGCAASDS